MFHVVDLNHIVSLITTSPGDVRDAFRNYNKECTFQMYILISAVEVFLTLCSI